MSTPRLAQRQPGIFTPKQLRELNKPVSSEAYRLRGLWAS
jgi:hypothetical protein